MESRFSDRLTKWYRKHRNHARNQLRKTVKDRVGRNKARRLLEESGREKKCAKCGTRLNLTVAHKDNNPQNNALSNLKWLCKACHGSHCGRYPKKLNKVPKG